MIHKFVWGSVFGNFINGMKTGSFQIKHPAARKTLRYLDVIDGEITVRQGEYLSKLEEGLDMHSKMDIQFLLMLILSFVVR